MSDKIDPRKVFYMYDVVTGGDTVNNDGQLFKSETAALEDATERATNRGVSFVICRCVPVKIVHPPKAVVIEDVSEPTGQRARKRTESPAPSATAQREPAPSGPIPPSDGAGISSTGEQYAGIIQTPMEAAAASSGEVELPGFLLRQREN